MKAMKIALVIGIAAICTLPAAAGPHHGRHHHHKGNDGVRLAANIIGLVNTALNGPAAVVPPPIVAAPPVIIRHCPPRPYCCPAPRRPYRHTPHPPIHHRPHGGHGRR